MEITLLIIIVCCVLLSGYFSATETAFSTLNRIRIKTLADNGNKKAIQIMRINENYDTFISTVLIGNNIVNILASSLATLLCINWFGGSSGPTVSTIAVTLIILLFGEVTPKSIAKKYPDKFALATVMIIRSITILLFPLNFVIGQWQKLLSLIFKKEEESGITDEELISIIEEAEDDGDFEKDVSGLLKSAIEFKDLEVGDVYTPNIDVTFLNINSSKKDIKSLFLSTGYSRIPVFSDRIDNIVGVLCYKDFFRSKEEDEIKNLLKPPLFVSKTQKIRDVLKILQNGQLHLAIATDEYGTNAGIITIEDIVEEIVGEIWDETDNIVEDVKVVNQSDYLVRGKANIEKVFDIIGLEEKANAKTVNGWVMEILGRIPAKGDNFTRSNFSFKVLKMDGRRIDNLEISKIIGSTEENK